MCPVRAGRAFSKGCRTQGEWREERNKGVRREEPRFGATGKNARASLAVSDKTLKKRSEGCEARLQVFTRGTLHQYFSFLHSNSSAI